MDQRMSDACCDVIQCCLIGHRKAIRFLSKNDVVVCTRRQRPRKNSRHEEFVLTIGRPNHWARKFIKDGKMVFDDIVVKGYPRK